MPYTLERFVDDLRAITARESADARVINAVKPLASRLALDRSWLEPHHSSWSDGDGYGVYLLHEEPDHRLAVFSVVWSPGFGVPPHDHGTWAVVAGVEGTEVNEFWKRVDDGSVDGRAELVSEGTRRFAEGETVAFLPHQIHSVRNEADTPAISLHVYGMHLNHTGRSKFDPEAGTCEPYLIEDR